jgi:protein-S-isoprenylcysteine O-methyltransferase Ste14
MASARNENKTTWQRIARRIRVPLGFVTAAIFLFFAQPEWRWIAISLPLVALGLWMRGYAAGYVKKNAELTRSGPYAHTRNPLYLGSMLLAAGFAVAAGAISSTGWWLAVLLLAMFLFIYIPTILSEEAFLRSEFSTFNDYAAKVPRLGWRFTAARFAGDSADGRFDASRFRHHREYNALIGAAAIYAALILRMIVFRGRA